MFVFLWYTVADIVLHKSHTLAADDADERLQPVRTLSMSTLLIGLVYTQIFNQMWPDEKGTESLDSKVGEREKVCEEDSDMWERPTCLYLKACQPVFVSTMN